MDIETRNAWDVSLEEAAAVDDYDGRYARPPRTKECAVVAERMLRAVWTVEFGRPIVEIIAGIETDDTSIDPVRVGHACADAIYSVTRYDLHTTQVRADITPNMDRAERAAEIALNDERRLQTLDVTEELALHKRFMEGTS